MTYVNGVRRVGSPLGVDGVTEGMGNSARTMGVGGMG